ncbi:MAG: extracellular solute-binding protein [Myxococcota bacterium]|nr:extracellular solute-binding protein [Myxococcota bacterium]
MFARLIGLLLGVALWLAAPAGRAADIPPGRVVVQYWEKWTDTERDAMQAVVDDFNRSQSKIFVVHSALSGVNQKTLMATAGGNPPDLAGVWANDVVDYADREALMPLDELARGTRVEASRYLPVYWDMGVYRGTLYGVPSVPVVTGLHWNKRLFREAGLDPERPPETIAELDAYAEKLTRVEAGKIQQIGFLPSEPPWFPFVWGFYFGGELWDGHERITLDSPENRRAYRWIQGHAQRYGADTLRILEASFGNFASSSDPFMSGRLAMALQGIWLANYIERFAPGMEWGAAPFPSERKDQPKITYCDTDMLVIPRGSRHPREAFEFIRYLSSQAATEKLALGQRKISPLREVSDDFFERHRHPFIRMFQGLAASPGARAQPKISVWKEYREETRSLFQRVWLLEATPEVALSEAQARVQRSFTREENRSRATPSRALAYAPVALLAAVVVGFAVGVVKKRRIGPSARQNASLARGLGFFSPWAIGLTVFTLYPILSSLVYSFCDYSVLSVPRWVGLANYAELFEDAVFWRALGNTLLYAAIALPGGLLVSFAVALLLDARVRFGGIYRTLVFLPSLTPVVASAMAWLWIFNAEYGILNHWLGVVSFGKVGPIPWLADPRTALPSLALMSVWSVGHTVVVLLAAMQDVPPAMYEAADIDGANLWQRVRHVTLPLVSPVLYFNLVIGLIGALQVFSQPFVMTHGGPARATLTYSMRLYENAFKFLRMGYASAMAWVMFLIILILTLLLTRASRSRVHYTGI